MAIKDIIKSFDILDWTMFSLLITQITLAAWWTYLHENNGILAGVIIGVSIGTLVMGLVRSARYHKEAAKRNRNRIDPKPL